MTAPNENTASRLGSVSTMDVEAAEKNQCSSSSSSLSDPPSNAVTPEAVNQMRGGNIVLNGTQSGSSTYNTQDLPSASIAGAATDPTAAESQEEDGPSSNQDDSRHVFDQNVQQLLIDLEDEVGVDLLLNSGDHDDAECLAVKVIWQQRKIDEMAEQISRLEGKIRDMGTMTLEVMEKQLNEMGSGKEQ